MIEWIVAFLVLVTSPLWLPMVAIMLIFIVSLVLLPFCIAAQYIAKLYDKMTQ